MTCIYTSRCKKETEGKKRDKNVALKRSLRMFPLCRDKRQISISSFFFYTPTICSITGKQTVRWDLLADSAFEVLCCALIRDNLSNVLLWSPWAENEINAMEMTQLLQSNIHTIWAEDWYHCPVPSSIFLLEKADMTKTATGRNHFSSKIFSLCSFERWVIGYACRLGLKKLLKYLISE